MVLEILAAIALAVASAGAAIVVIELIFLAIGVVIDWFRERAALVRTDPSKLAVTVAEEIESGNVSYFQGIFDTDTQQFGSDVRRIKAQDIDPTIVDAHAGRAVMIWE